MVMAGCSAVAVRGRPVLATPGGFGLGSNHTMIHPTIERATAAFACAIVCGWPGFAFFATDANPKVPLLGGLITGFGGSWILMKGWDWIIWRAENPSPVRPTKPQRSPD